jgi:hypothetical protein
MAIELSHIERLIQSGAIRVGMTRAELFSLLGPPEDQGGTSRKYSFPSFYKYGEVQFVFPHCRNASDATQQGLTYVYIDDSESVDEPRYLIR